MEWSHLFKKKKADKEKEPSKILTKESSVAPGFSFPLGFSHCTVVSALFLFLKP